MAPEIKKLALWREARKRRNRQLSSHPQVARRRDAWRPIQMPQVTLWGPDRRRPRQLSPPGTASGGRASQMYPPTATRRSHRAPPLRSRLACRRKLCLEVRQVAAPGVGRGCGRTVACRTAWGWLLGRWTTRSVYDRYGIVSDADMREVVGRSAEAEAGNLKVKI